MAWHEAMLLVSVSFANVLAAFPNMAARMGWRTGMFFTLPATKSTLIAAAITFGLVVVTLVNIFVTDAMSAWWLVGLPAAYLVGGGIVTAMFRENSGIVGLVAAPLSFAAYLFLSMIAPL